MNTSKFLLQCSKIYTVSVRHQTIPVPPHDQHSHPVHRAEDILVVHGGACNFEDNLKEAKISGVKDAAREGYRVLQDTNDPMYAVEKSIRVMESIDVFNAGHGSVLNEDGHVEMDASIMLGTDMSAGGVAAIKDVLHPISVARKIMEKSPHIMLSCEGAYIYAKNLGLELAMPGGLVTRRARRRHKNNTIFDQKELGTVGAVSLSKGGQTAAGSSSGGLNRKKAGRFGNAARPGSGCFADDLICAVTTSGHGESIATMCLANAIAKAVEEGATPMEALVENLKNLRKTLQNNGGAILVTKQGDVGIYFTTKRMPYAFIKNGKLTYGGVDKGDEQTEDL